MTKKQTILTIVLFVFASSLFAQVEESVNPDENEKKGSGLTNRLVFGGDIGLSFGTVTYIKLAPVVGYKITSRLTAGVGPIYIYEKYKEYNFESSTYGGKALVSFTIIKGADNGGSLQIGNIMLHAENEVVNVEHLVEEYIGGYYYYYLGNRKWIDNLLVGAGLSQPIAGRFSVSLFVLFDVTQNQDSPYTNPIVKFGFNF